MGGLTVLYTIIINVTLLHIYLFYYCLTTHRRQKWQKFRVKYNFHKLDRLYYIVIGQHTFKIEHLTSQIKLFPFKITRCIQLVSSKQWDVEAPEHTFETYIECQTTTTKNMKYNFNII